MSKVSSNQFADFLISRLEHLDEKILRDIRPYEEDRIEYRIPKWWLCREECRKLSERDSYSESKCVKEKIVIRDGWIGHVELGMFLIENGIEHTFDRFEKVFPKLGNWSPATDKSCIGTPCDPTRIDSRLPSHYR